MNRRNAAVAAIEVLQVGLTIQIRVPQLDDRIVGAVEVFELRRQRRRDGGQVIAADVEQLQMRRVPESVVGDMTDIVVGQTNLFQVVAPREIVRAEAGNAIVL